MTTPQDAERRRHQVASALLAVTARDGLEAASLARVAAEAGTSVGLIQRYFRTKDELLTFAFDYLYERTLGRLEAVAPGGSVRAGLARGLAVLLPLDEERIAEGRMWLAYIARAAVDARHARGHAEGMAAIRARCAEAIRQAQVGGEAPTHLDPDREALMLAAFVDGLIVDLLGDQAAVSPRVAEQALQAYLDRLFTDTTGGHT